MNGKDRHQPQEVKNKELDAIVEWVEERLRVNDVPRFDDVVYYAHAILGFKNLTKRQIVKRLRILEVYQMNSRQQRERHRYKKYRPILVNDIGYLHCDIGFFAVTSEYPTPEKYRAGFLVAKDVCSRFVYVYILNGNRKAPEIVKGFSDIFRQFQKQNDSQKVLGVSFDRERSVMSHQVQDFFKENNVAFHAFEMTASKSKLAEGAIRLIREKIAKLQVFSVKIQWWNLIYSAVSILNAQKIVVDNVRLSYSPREINKYNLDDFLGQLDRAAPAYFFSHFDIPTALVHFEFNIGDVVRPKLIVTSAEVLGKKRSAVTLENVRFKVVAQIPFVTRRMTIGKAYRCRYVDHPQKKPEIFDEWDLALSK